MDKKIPSKDKLDEVVKQVLSQHLKVNSQEELSRLVLSRLKREDKNYVVSSVRVKRAALDVPEIEVKAKTKKTVKMLKISDCPICHSDIEPLEVKNLVEKKVLIGYQCTGCAYQSDLESFMPMKYAFVWKSI
jgi:ABC-type molybdate transport system ATPase subunit